MKAEMWRMFEVEAKAAGHQHMIGPATGFLSSTVPNAKSHDEECTMLMYRYDSKVVTEYFDSKVVIEYFSIDSGDWIPNKISASNLHRRSLLNKLPPQFGSSRTFVYLRA